MVWKIVALSEPISGQAIVIDRDMIIGRHQQADIVLQASHVSRRHAQLVLKEEGRQLWIQDLGSSNGTFVNGEQVNEKQLKHLDEINFESLRFRVSVEADNAQTVETPSALEKVVPSDEGMPTLTERASDVQVGRDGMPQNVGIPKPAPIPEHVDLKAEPEPTPVAIPESKGRVAQEQEQQKNSKVGVISIVVILILILLVWLGFGA